MLLDLPSSQPSADSQYQYSVNRNNIRRLAFVMKDENLKSIQILELNDGAVQWDFCSRFVSRSVPSRSADSSCLSLSFCAKAGETTSSIMAAATITPTPAENSIRKLFLSFLFCFRFQHRS